MPENPYAAPEANVDAPPLAGGSHAIKQPRSVAAGRGWEWIVGGFRYFTASPVIWIVACAVWLLILIVLSVIPLVNVLVTIISPAIAAGFMIGCNSLDRQQGFSLSHAFAGFQTNVAQLLVAGALYFGGTMLLVLTGVLVLMLTGGLGALTAAASGSAELAGLGLAGLAIGMLVVLGLSIPLIMSIYFAAPLIALGNMRATEAMKLSFMGCLRNLLPFLVFGLIAFVLLILAAIPVFLGYLVLGPAMVAAGYAAYRDIFVNSDTRALGPAGS